MVRRGLLLLSLSTLTAACSLPAPSFESYRAKAIDAAEQTISQGQTAILTAALLERDRLFAPTAAVQLEDAEEAATAATQDFAAVLPPDDRSQDLRGTVLPDLQLVSDLISRMRFALRHRDVEQAVRLRSSLDDPLDRLERWTEPFA